jgi:putative transposase
MGWKETDAMNERAMMIGEWLRGEDTVSGLAARYGVSRKSVYKWIGRHAQSGWGALEDRSRAALNHPNAVSAEVERLLLELKAGRPLWGAPKLRCKLLEALGEGKCPAESTVSEILRRHGLSGVRGKERRRAVPSQEPMGHCAGANQVWSADYKGWFRTGDGKRCTPLTITDGHSRYLLQCRGLGGGTGMMAAKPLFIAAFREFGLPEAMRTDNGPPFASCGLGGLSELSVWWMLLGIRLERIEPGKPQQNGRHERMHRTLKEATANPPRANLREQQAAFDAFREEYNMDRPHEALGQKPPATCYERSGREYPLRLPKQAGYPDDWEKRRVRGAGQMKWKGKEVRVSDALHGLEIGLKPVGDGRWAVYFEKVELGLFDERKRRVTGLERPKRKAAGEGKAGGKEEEKV